MSRIPGSVIILGLLCALLALQAFPYTGIFLMLVAAPFIAGLMVHAFLIALGAEALSGRVWRGFVAIPVIAYGGYYAMYALESYDIAAKSAELRAANPGQVLAFDPNLHALVTPDANHFVHSHAIPVAYEANANFLPERYLAYRLIAREQCGGIVRDSQARIMTFGVHFEGVFQRGVCELRMPEAPSNKTVYVFRRGDDENWKRKPGIIEQTTEIQVDGKVIGAYRTASIWRLPRVPVGYIGCGLVSSGPSWKCDADFWRSREVIGAAPEGVDAAKYDTPVSVMLGLRKYTAADFANFKSYAQNTTGLARAAEEPARVENNVFAALDRVLAGEDFEPPHNMGYSIALNPQRLAPLATRMAQRFAELTEGRTSPNRQNQADGLATGMAALPREAFATIADQVFDVVHRSAVAERYSVLYLRAADAGAKTLPFYKAALDASRAHPSLRAALVLAFCRLGQSDADVVAEFKRRFIADVPDHLEVKSAIFVTLIKLGEEPFARENVTRLPKRLQNWAELVLSGAATTEIGPNNCMGERWGMTDYLGPAMTPALEWAGHNGWKRRTGV